MEIKDLQMMHDFLVAESLVVPVILGIKFLQKNHLMYTGRCEGQQGDVPV